jgi:hypothetical protein
MSIEAQFRRRFLAAVLDMIVTARGLFAAAGIGSQSFKTSTVEL